MCMSGIVIAALVILLLLALCIIDYSARRVRKSAEDVCHKAARLSMDMDTMDGYLVEIREQIRELSQTLDKIEKDVE